MVVYAGDSTSGGVTLSHANATALTAGSVYHVILSVDMSDTGKRHFYINDVSDDRFSTGSYNDRNIPYSLTTASSVGSAFDGSAKTKAQVYDLYVNNAYIDLSIEANRRKFITADAKPAVMGSNGQNPTGSQPLIYFNGFNRFTNRGTAGSFTQYGTLTQGDSI